MAHILAWAAAGSHRTVIGAESMSATSDKHTLGWQTYSGDGAGWCAIAFGSVASYHHGVSRISCQLVAFSAARAMRSKRSGSVMLLTRTFTESLEEPNESSPMISTHLRAHSRYASSTQRWQVASAGAFGLKRIKDFKYFFPGSGV
jgi:hypothetical protein